jgi:glycosyltransferase involved in cell wall biosynthesis
MRFLVLGDGPENYRASLQRYAVSLGLGAEVMWRPATPDVVGMLNALDLIVSTSAFGEGTHNVLIEAMSLGLPVVATDIGDARQVVGPGGSVVAPRRPDEIARAVLYELARDDVSRRADRRRRIETQYSVETYVGRMAAHLRALALAPRKA